MAFRFLNSLRMFPGAQAFPSLFDSVIATPSLRGSFIVARRLTDTTGASSSGPQNPQHHQNINIQSDPSKQHSHQESSSASDETSNPSSPSASSSASSNPSGRGHTSAHWPDAEIVKADRAGRRRNSGFFRPSYEDFFDEFDRDFWGSRSPARMLEQTAFPWGSEASPTRQRQGRMVYFQPKVDIADEGGSLVFHAEVPGMAQKDLKVEINEDRLKLSGERTEEKMEKEKNWTRQERVKGYFTREFNLPRGVDPTQITAKLKDGVLEIRVPKPVQLTTHAVNIE